jgi:hypothetical protein
MVLVLPPAPAARVELGLSLSLLLGATAALRLWETQRKTELTRRSWREKDGLSPDDADWSRRTDAWRGIWSCCFRLGGVERERSGQCVRV